MAIVPINQPRGPAQRVERDRRDPLDVEMGRVLTALQIANVGFGFINKFDEQDAIEAQTALANARKAQVEAGTAQSELRTSQLRTEIAQAPTTEEVQRGRDLGFRQEEAKAKRLETESRIKQEELKLLQNPDPRQAKLLDAKFEAEMAKSEKAKIERDKAAAEWDQQKTAIDSTIEQAGDPQLGKKLAKIQGEGAEQKKRFDSVMMSLAGVKQMKEGLQKEDFVARPTITGKNDFTFGRELFVEGLARMQTGAVINSDEQKRFEGFVPGISDMMFGDPDKMMQQVESDLLRRAQTFGFTPQDVDKYIGQLKELPSTAGPAPAASGLSREQRQAEFEKLLGGQ